MKPTQREKLVARSSRFEDSDRNPDRKDVPSRVSFAAEAKSTDKIYGLIPVLEALRSGQRAIDSITIAEGARHDRMRDLLALAKKANVPVHRVPRVSLDRSLKEITHQGVIARTAAARYQDADELLESVAARVGSADQPLILGLDGIEDPRNFGAILRTAECAGVHGVFIPERRAVGLTDIVAKAAAGAVEYVPIARATNLVRLIEQLKERNIWVVGAAAEGTSNYPDWDWTLPSAIFLGSEGAGLHRLVKERCDTLVRIPVLGRLGSLNVSVTAGVLLYEALRQRAR
jgi:23S rRNA (guanosine2251-2'-O)-methyltransferase